MSDLQKHLTKDVTSDIVKKPSILGKDGHGIHMVPTPAPAPLGKDGHGTLHPAAKKPILGKDGHGQPPVPGILGKGGAGTLKPILGKDGHGIHHPPSHTPPIAPAPPKHLKHPADGSNDKIPKPDPATKAHIEKHVCHLEGSHVVPKTHLKPDAHVKGMIDKAKSVVDTHIKDPHMKKELQSEIKDLETEHDKMKVAVKDHKKKEEAHKALETELDKAHTQLKELEAKMHALTHAKDDYCGGAKKEAAKKELDAKKEEVKAKAVAVAKAEKEKKKAEIEVVAADHKMSGGAEAVRKLTHVAKKTATTAADAASADKTHKDVHDATAALKHQTVVKKECDFINYDLVGKLQPLPHIDAKFPCMGFAVDDHDTTVAVKCAMPTPGTCPTHFDKDHCFVMTLTDFQAGLNSGH